MTGYIVRSDCEYIDEQKQLRVYDDKEEAYKAAIELVKEIAVIYEDDYAYDNPEDVWEEDDTYYDADGDLQVEIIDCEIFLKDRRDKEQRIREVFTNVGAEDWPNDIVKCLDTEHNDTIWGPLRVFKGTDKKAHVSQEYQDFTNNELLTYILTGDF